MRPILIRLCLVHLALALATPALAGDGVVEINQTCALSTGCFSGDAAGYPVTISVPGSYKLTSNLSLGGANVTGIRIATNNVTLNLAGFQIGCTVFTPPMTVEFCGEIGGSGRGVEVDDRTTRVGIEVHSGSIVGAGDHGVVLGDKSSVHDLRVSQSGDIGIWLRDAALVSSNVVYDNGTTGLEAAVGATILSNSIHANGGTGMIASAGSTISSNTVFGNGGAGISGFGGGMTISGNSIYDNDAGGVGAFGGSTVERNSIRSNMGVGLVLTSDSGYRGNVFFDNDGGTVTSGVNLGGNLCNGSTTCP